jgi:MFS family permease
LIEAVGAASWGFVHSVPQAYAVATVVALGNAGIWPPQNTMMSRMVSEDARQKFFGIQFMMLNLGLGLGGMISSFIVRVDEPDSFKRLFLIDGLSYVIFYLFIASLQGVGGKLARSSDEEHSDGSYREVLRDRRLIKLTSISILLLTCGYASMDAGIPALLTTYGGLSVSQLGPLWAVNTGVVVLLQISILKRLEGRSRTRLLGLVGLLWSISWIVLGIGVQAKTMTFVIACLSTAIFAAGETVWSPIGAALQNAIAPEHLRGRYNAVGALAWVIASAIGPVMSGLMLGQGLEIEWIAVIALGSLIAGLWGMRLQRNLSAAEDGREHARQAI